jgi:hypothetical protein
LRLLKNPNEGDLLGLVFRQRHVGLPSKAWVNGLKHFGKDSNALPTSGSKLFRSGDLLVKLPTVTSRHAIRWTLSVPFVDPSRRPVPGCLKWRQWPIWRGDYD